MIKIRSQLSNERLQSYLLSLNYHIDGSGAKMAVQPCEMPEKIALLFQDAIEEIEKIRNLQSVYVMINKLESKITVPKHRDWLKGTPLQPNKPCLERWHLPIQTNEDAGYWDETHGCKHFDICYWHGPIPYWLNHFVYNVGSTDRVHLVVDLDCKDALGSYYEDS